MKSAITVGLALLLAGCSDVPSKNNVSDANNNANNVSNTSNNTANVSNSVSECDGSPPGCGVCAAPSCDDGVWTCLDTPCAPNSLTNNVPIGCGVTSESSLAGVSIEFTAERCSWTLDEVAGGITIPYVISITEEQEIMPQSQQNGCDEPGVSGMRQQETVFGGDQSWCICDVGLCNGEPLMVDLVAGDYDFAVSWDGVNWTGPSDFGNPKGEPFPPGEYTVQVRALGTAGDMEYEVSAQMQILLTE